MSRKKKKRFTPVTPQPSRTVNSPQSAAQQPSADASHDERKTAMQTVRHEDALHASHAESSLSQEQKHTTSPAQTATSSADVPTDATTDDPLFLDDPTLFSDDDQWNDDAQRKSLRERMSGVAASVMVLMRRCASLLSTAVQFVRHTRWVALSALFLIGVVLGAGIKAMAHQRITIGYDDYRISDVRKDGFSTFDFDSAMDRVLAEQMKASLEAQQQQQQAPSPDAATNESVPQQPNQ